MAKYTGYADSDNDLDLDDPYFEDLLELDFIIQKIERIEFAFIDNFGKPKITVDGLVFLNCHNFFIKYERYKEENN